MGVYLRLLHVTIDSAVLRPALATSAQSMVEVGDIAAASTVEDKAPAEGANMLAAPRLRPCQWLCNLSAAAVEDMVPSSLRQDSAAAAEDMVPSSLRLDRLSEPLLLPHPWLPRPLRFPPA